MHGTDRKTEHRQSRPSRYRIQGPLFFSGASKRTIPLHDYISMTSENASMLSLDTTVVATDQSVSSDLAGERVLLHLESGVYYGLNEVGSHIWEALTETTTLQEVVTRLEDIYDVERSVLEDDVLDLVTDLLDAGLVDTVPR